MWVLAGDITTDSGIPFLSVKICLFVPSLLLSVVGLFPVFAPLKAISQIYYLLIVRLMCDLSVSKLHDTYNVYGSTIIGDY